MSSNIKFSGRVGKEPELRFTPEGKAVLTFSVSLYTGGSKKDGYTPSVWVRVSAWEDLAAKTNELIGKGDVVTVAGLAKAPRTYKNSEGVEVSAGLEVTASEIVKGDEFKEQVDEF